MRRPYKTSNTALGARLEEAIQQTWGSHRALAEQTGIKEGTITKYVRHGRLPAGAEMVKLAQALPGQIEYILTGQRPTEIEQTTVGSLPPRLREMIMLADQLSPADQGTLAALVRTLAYPDRQSYARLIADMISHIEGLDLTIEEGRQVRAAGPGLGSEAVDC